MSFHQDQPDMHPRAIFVAPHPINDSIGDAEQNYFCGLGTRGLGSIFGRRASRCISQGGAGGGI
jgi:hypothetical protein